MDRPQKPGQNRPSWPGAAEAPDAQAASGVPTYPLPGWPTLPTVEYLTKLILLGLLLLAVPYVIGNLIVRPAETMAAVAQGATRAPRI